jgi:hypothetical protein
MGLDILELVMSIEAHFGVTIPDERAERITTVGELYGFLLGQAGRRTPTPCPTSRAFYRLRRTLMSELGVDRGRVRPDARLRDLFPRASGGTPWSRLATLLDLPDLPEMEPPPRRGPPARVFRIALEAATAVWGLLYFLLPFLPGGQPPPAFWLLVWGLLVLLVGEFYGMFWLATFLDPFPVPRVRDLVVRLTARQHDPSPGGPPTDPAAAAVWTDLVAVLAAHTGMAAEEIRPEQRFSDL